MAAHKGWRIRVLTFRDTGTYWNVAEVNFYNAQGIRQRTGGTAYGSANFSGTTYNAAKTFDANTGTTFSGDKETALTQGHGNFLAYIFAAPVEVVACFLDEYDGTAPATYALEYSDDSTNGWNGTWTEAARKSNPATAAVLPIFTADLPVFDDPGPRLCWRVLSVNIASDNGSIGNPALSEVQFRSVPDAAELHTGGTPRGSTQFDSSNYNYAKAFDNNVTTAWVASNQSGAAWIGYVFPVAKVVKQVMMRARDGYADTCSPRLFYIQWADVYTGTWTTAWIGTAPVQWADRELRTFTDPRVNAPVGRRRRLGGFLG